MWRKLLLFSAIFFTVTHAQAASIVSWQCEEKSAGESLCTIQLEGEVLSGERLFLPNAQDSDKLFFHEKLLGSTGFLLSYPYAAVFFPRVYSLQPLQGQTNPQLLLETHAYFSTSASHFEKARVMPADFPLRKAYLPLLLRTLAFGILLWLSGFVILHVRRTTIDGWTYPIEEIRWFFGSLFSYLLLSSDYSHVAVPGLWTASLHEFAARVSLSVALWCLSALLLEARFNDRSCVERGLHVRPSRRYGRFSDLGLLVSLLAALPPISAGAITMLALQALPVAISLSAAIRSMEWKRVLKRSSLSPLLFHFSLLAMAGSTTLFLPLFFAFGWGTKFVFATAWATLILGAWRMHRYFRAKTRSQMLAAECRHTLMRHSKGNERLLALCDFIEDEWGAARVSIISVEDQLGLVLASAGPDAIPDTQRSKAKKLGPFLKRVCREGHILYAPSAEELGADLQKLGLKHSSLAIPFRQRGEVRAVLCIMADEGERIPPLDAAVLELLAGDLTLEILSAVALHVAEEKCERLLVIARQADGVAVEHLDNWGHLHYADKEEERILVGAKLELLTENLDSPSLRKTQTEFNRELRAFWHALALSFEFVPRELKEDFWVLSPKEFRQPFLRALGPERAAIALASALERQARALAAKEAYLLLAQPISKVVAGLVRLRLVSYGSEENGGLELDSQDYDRLQSLRAKASSSGPIFWGDAAQLQTENFQFRWVSAGLQDTKEFYSILGVTADKKETRKLEAKALETAKESLRKAA